MTSVFEGKPLPTKPYSHGARWSIDSWAWEILSSIISIIAIVIIVVLIFFYDDKPLPKLPYQIGLNSIIALLGTVSKSAFLLIITSCISQYKWMRLEDVVENNSLQDLQLHDEASRGPWGSLMLLFSQKKLYWVKLGALATVLSLAFDPMYQALIKIDQRPRYQNHPVASVKRALSFEAASNYIPGGSDGYFSNDWYGAITNAMLNKNSILETKPSCPTSNCTFPVFSSLAFCSNCIDIAQFMQQNSKCTEFEHHSDDYLVDCTYWLPLSSSGSNYSHHHGNYWILHSGSDFKITWQYSNAGDNKRSSFQDAPAFFTKFLFVDGANSTDSERIRLSNGKVIPSSFATIALIKIAPKTGSADTAFVDTAHICALSVCAKEYNITMTSGLLRFEVVSTSYSKLTRHDSDGGYVGNSSYTFAFSNNANDFTFVANETIIGLYKTSILGDSFEHKMVDYLRALLEDDLYFRSDPLGNPVALGQVPSLLQTALNASIDIPKTMDRIAEAMTNRLGDISDHTIQGQSGITELYIRISWWWLLLPASCILFGTIFLAWVMIITRKRKLPIWKASELALLFHGFDFSIGDYLTMDMHKASEMENIASALQVRLGRDAQGMLKIKRKLE